MAMIAGDMLLEAFRNHHIEYIFCSPGSEWVPVWEGLAKLYVKGERSLKYINCRHESLAVSMATGYAKATGHLTAVLLHAGIGPLHAAMEIRAAYRARAPMIICTGNTSCYGEDNRGLTGWLSRLSDLGGPDALVRSYVKWSNSVTSLEALLDSVHRGCQIAQTNPPGPVFVAIPWDLLLESRPEVRMAPASAPLVLPEPRLADLKKVAKRLLESKQPIIITEHAGEKMETVPKLVELVELLGIPVFECIDPAFANFPKNHPLHMGYDASEALQEADTVFIVGGTTPWYPPSAFPRNGAMVILLDEDPLKEQLPYWGYRIDLLVTAEMRQWLSALVDTVRTQREQLEWPVSICQERFDYWRTKHEQLKERWKTEALAEQRNKPISTKWFLHLVNKMLPGNSIILNETVAHSLLLRQYLAEPDSYFKVACGGLGTGLGMAAGVKLAHQDSPVVLFIGDGSFNYNPVLAGLGLYQEYHLPILIIILNNGGYVSIRHIHQKYCPKGVAVSNNTYFGVDISPQPDYTRIAEAFDAYGQKVEAPDDIQPAITAALEQVAIGRAALLDVILDSPGGTGP